MNSGASTILPWIPSDERIFAQLVVAEGLAPAADVRAAMEELVRRRSSGQPDVPLRKLLVERGVMSVEQARYARRVRSSIVLECRACNLLFRIRPFDPLFALTCKHCGGELSWPRQSISHRQSAPPAVNGVTAQAIAGSREPLPSTVPTPQSDSHSDDDASGLSTPHRESVLQTPVVMPEGAEPTTQIEPLDPLADHPEFSNAANAEKAARLEATVGPEFEVGLIGHRLGEFVITRLIGRGGMGSVFHAVDANGRDAAIKILAPAIATNPEYLERFRREARLASRLDHPNLIGLWEFGEEPPWVFLVMPYVKGLTLQQMVARQNGPLPVRETVRFIAEALVGIQAAHEMEIIHRDIKPDNILITPEGQVKVLDFGLARDPIAKQITMQGQTVGTPRFMSPQQWQGETMDPRCDIHAIGMTLYYVLSGRFPYPDADSPLGIYQQMIENEPVPLSHWRPEVPPDFNAVVMRMIAKPAQLRYPNADSARRALLAVIPTHTTRRVPSRPPGVPSPNALATTGVAHGPPGGSYQPGHKRQTTRHTLGQAQPRRATGPLPPSRPETTARNKYSPQSPLAGQTTVTAIRPWAQRWLPESVRRWYDRLTSHQRIGLAVVAMVGAMIGAVTILANLVAVGPTRERPWPEPSTNRPIPTPTENRAVPLSDWAARAREFIGAVHGWRRMTGDAMAERTAASNLYRTGLDLRTKLPLDSLDRMAAERPGGWRQFDAYLAELSAPVADADAAKVIARVRALPGTVPPAEVERAAVDLADFPAEFRHSFVPAWRKLCLDAAEIGANAELQRRAIEVCHAGVSTRLGEFDTASFRAGDASAIRDLAREVAAVRVRAISGSWPTRESLNGVWTDATQLAFLAAFHTAWAGHDQEPRVLEDVVMFVREFADSRGAELASAFYFWCRLEGVPRASKFVQFDGTGTLTPFRGPSPEVAGDWAQVAGPSLVSPVCDMPVSSRGRMALFCFSMAREAPVADAGPMRLSVTPATKLADLPADPVGNWDLTAAIAVGETRQLVCVMGPRECHLILGFDEFPRRGQPPMHAVTASRQPALRVLTIPTPPHVPPVGQTLTFRIGAGHRVSIGDFFYQTTR